MSFVESIQTCLRKYADFKGRASRPEYWWFVLFAVLCYFVAVILSGAVGESVGALVVVLVLLGLVVPSLAVAVRRLHDIGRPGWWYFITFVPYVGGIIMLVLLARKGETGEQTRPGHPRARPRFRRPALPPPLARPDAGVDSSSAQGRCTGIQLKVA